MRNSIRKKYTHQLLLDHFHRQSTGRRPDQPIWDRSMPEQKVLIRAGYSSSWLVTLRQLVERGAENHRWLLLTSTSSRCRKETEL